MVKQQTNSVMKKIQQARIEWLKEPRKKSKYNNFQKYNYFVLKDILPPVNKIFNELKLYSHYNLYKDHAALVITDIETGDSIKFKLPVQQIENPTMQQIGSINTYAKRYLYMNALEIEEEEDGIDSVDQEEKPKETKEELVKKISEALGEKKLATWLKNAKKEKIEDFTEEELAKVWTNYSKNTKK